MPRKLKKGQERLSNGKIAPTKKELLFAKNYAKTLNGTQSVKAVYDVKNDKTASVIASENLGKPRVLREIDRILDKEGLTDTNVIQIHERNLSQSENLGVSQQAVRDYYTLKGYNKDKDKDSKVNIAFIINK